MVVLNMRAAPGRFQTHASRFVGSRISLGRNAAICGEDVVAVRVARLASRNGPMPR
jgi:hypothetical protein